MRIKKCNVDVVGATFMAPVVVVINSPNGNHAYDGRHEGSPYDIYVPRLNN